MTIIWNPSQCKLCIVCQVLSMHLYKVKCADLQHFTKLTNIFRLKVTNQ